MASFKITFRSSVAKDFKRIDQFMVRRIMRAIQALASNPMPQSSKKLVGSAHTYRIRVGDYRVIYIINQQLGELEVQRVRHRKDVYL